MTGATFFIWYAIPSSDRLELPVTVARYCRKRAAGDATTAAFAGLTLMEHDVSGFWEKAGYNDHGDPWKEQRYTGD